MKAAVCHAFGQPLSVEEITLDPPRAGEVRVDLKACAICHSDIFYAEGAWGGDLPAVYGHEAAGVVAELGEGVTDLALGDHVLVTLIRACGHCASCAGGHPVSCGDAYHRLEDSPIRLDGGGQAEHGLKTGAFAEGAVVHASQCAVIPKDMAWDVASLISCGVITGIGAVVNSARVGPGATVAVIGAGGVGLNTIQGAALAGATTIIALDIADEKLSGAREFGATHGVNALDKDAVAQVRALTGGRGVDYCFVTVGAPQAFTSGPEFLAPRGEMVLVGMPPVGAKAEYEPVNITAASQVFRGSAMGETVLKRDIPWLVEMYRQGRLKLDELITGRWTLDQINEAIADTKAGAARRNVILF